MKLTILGAPRTKKNHGFRTKQGHQMPSVAFAAWNRIAQLQLALWRSKHSGWPFTVPVNVAAEFYRVKLIGDAVGYYQALADALEEGQIVQNDALIVSWDGSRMLKDAERPRIEIEITEFR